MYYGKELYLVRSSYKNNGSLYLGFQNKDGEYYGDLTVNLPNSGTLPSDCAFVDTNNVHDAEKLIIDNGLGCPTGQMARSGFCVYPVFRFKKLEDIPVLD